MSKRRGGFSFLPNNSNNSNSSSAATILSSPVNGAGVHPRNNGNNNVTMTSSLMAMAFLVGGLLGHFHGRYYGSTSSCDSAAVVLSSSSSSSSAAAAAYATTATSCIEKETDGWHAIRVFYGDTQKHLTPMLEKIRSQITIDVQNVQEKATETSAAIITDTKTTTLTTSNKAAPDQLTTATLDAKGRMWFAQARQDQVVWALLRQKKGGYFIDLAANDALELSNTVSLEVHGQWRGLCIEPNPAYWYNLTYYRTCHVVAAVVGKTRMDPVYFRYDALDHGGIAGDEFDNGKRWERSSLVQYTVPLLEVLQYHQAPRVIDYLSLDVEGAEEFILQSFPFDQYTISILTVERPKENLRKLLEQNGYQFLKRLTKWGETLWAHQSVLSQLDVAVLDKFGPLPKPPKKEKKR